MSDKSDRPLFNKFAPFDPNEHTREQPDLLADEPLPPPPRLPSGIGLPDTKPAPDPLVELTERVTALSEQLFLPSGLLQSLFASLEMRAAARHEEQMRALTTVANGLVELTSSVAELAEAVARLEPEQERHEARLRLLEGNGHVGNGAGE